MYCSDFAIASGMGGGVGKCAPSARKPIVNETKQMHQSDLIEFMAQAQLDGEKKLRTVFIGDVCNSDGCALW